MKTFRRSLETGLEAIELDVWLTLDGIPIVSHGGIDGNLKDYGYPEEFLYDWTFEQLQTLDAGEGEKIPKFEEVVECFRGNIFINIELKAPRSEECKPKYNRQLAAETVF